MLTTAAWFKAAGGLYIPIVVLTVFAADAGVSVLSNWWITYWSDSGSEKGQNYYLMIYALINLGAVVVGLFRQLFLALVALTASRCAAALANRVPCLFSFPCRARCYVFQATTPRSIHHVDSESQRCGHAVSSSEDLGKALENLCEEL